jgi:copper homeostasis protein (lipoprotein)
MRVVTAFGLAALIALPVAAAADEGPLGPLPKSFAGMLPSAGPGIDWQLDLLADGSFQLRRTYRDRGPDAVEDAIGRWVVGSDQASLVLDDGGEGPVGFAIEGPDRLRLLDPTLGPIESELPYALEAAELPPLEPELELRGLYRYMADAAIFDECLTGRRLPVAFVADNVSLERAYLALQESHGLEPGAPVLAKVLGRIGLLPPMEGDGLQPQLEPLRFVAVHPGEACPEPFAEAALRGTEWQLMGLGEDMVALEEGQRRPDLMLSPDELRMWGYGGCNRLLGGFAAYGGQLRFSQTASTMMACAVGMELEQELLAALAATERYRVLGRQLDLLDKDGQRLARFVAGEAG